MTRSGSVFHSRSDGICILPEVGSCRRQISGLAVPDVDEIIACRVDGFAQLHLGDSRLIAQLCRSPAHRCHIGIVAVQIQQIAVQMQDFQFLHYRSTSRIPSSSPKAEAAGTQMVPSLRFTASRSLGVVVLNDHVVPVKASQFQTDCQTTARLPEQTTQST